MDEERKRTKKNPGKGEKEQPFFPLPPMIIKGRKEVRRERKVCSSSLSTREVLFLPNKMSGIGLIGLLVVLLVVVIVITLFDTPTRSMVPGAYKIIDQEVSCMALPSCFYQNSDSPYGRVLFPAQGGIPTQPAALLALFFGVFTLTPLQAVVIFTKVPNAGLWSLIPYLWTQTHDGPILFASLSDGLSNFTIDLEEDGEVPGFGPIGVKNPSIGDPFTVILTRNPYVYRQEVSTLMAAGYDLNVNGPIYPLFYPDNGPTVITPTTTFTVLTRATNFPSPADVEAYVNAPPQPAYQVTYDDLLVRALPIALPGQPIPSDGLALKIRPDEPSELPLLPAFNQFVNEQLAGVTVVQELDFFPFLQSQLGEPYSSGYQCIAAQVNCQGDNRQAVYNQTTAFTYGAGQELWVMGVNHILTGKSIYTTLSIYFETNATGIKSLSLAGEPQFYKIVWTPLTAGTLYRLIERAYLQPYYPDGSPALIGAASDSIISPRAFLVTV